MAIYDHMNGTDWGYTKQNMENEMRQMPYDFDNMLIESVQRYRWDHRKNKLLDTGYKSWDCKKVIFGPEQIIGISTGLWSGSIGTLMEVFFFML